MKKSILNENQVKVLSKLYKEGKDHFKLIVSVRYDDSCKNGHNSLSITGDIFRVTREGKVKAGGAWRGGRIHEDIQKHFPDLVPAIPFHLCSTDGPMHYIANTVFHAGDRDCWGMRKGEFKQDIDKATGLPEWELEKIPDHTVARDTRPNSMVVEYVPCGRTGEGKERDLDAARHCAIWPEATDEELTAPGLEDRLKDRLPALMERFQAIVESLGFTY